MRSRIAASVAQTFRAQGRRWSRLSGRGRLVAAGGALAVLGALVAGLVLVLTSGGGGKSNCDRPLCVEVLGPSGDAVRPMTPVTIRLAGRVDRNVAVHALQIKDAPAGHFDLQHDVLTFKPDWPGFALGTTYDVSLKLSDREVPRGADPVDLGFRFTTEGKLNVASAFPQDGAQEVGLDAAVMLQFSRSVAPLTVIDKRGPQGILDFDPPMLGEGRWLNTSLYTFAPAGAGWSPSTTYKARVLAGLANQLGATLDQDYVFSFTTLRPKVLTFFPLDNTTFVAPEPEIKVGFNQPIDRASAEGAFSVVAEASRARVDGRFEWLDDRTFLFHPARPIALATTFLATVRAGVTAPGVTARTADDVGWRFTTVGVPRIASTDPLNGAQSAQRYGVTITFSNPMDHDSVEKHIAVEPKPDAEPYFNWDPGDLVLRLGFQMPPSAPFRVTLTTDAQDRYGQHLAEPLDLRFVTERQQPGFSLFRSSTSGTYDAYLDPVAGATSWNLNELDFALYHLTSEGLIAGERGGQTLDPPDTDLIRRWSEPIANPLLDQPVITTTRLAGTGEKLPEGIYAIRVTAPGTLGFETMPIVISSANVITKWTPHELLVWMVDMQSGAPLAGMPFQVLSRDAGPIATGITDADGVAKVTTPDPGSGDYYPGYYVSAVSGGRTVLSGTNWNNGIAPWFASPNIPFSFELPDMVGYLYTDRPIYRPGETVYFKGVVRKDDDARYSLPPSATPLTLTIRDDRGHTIESQPVQLSDLGTFDTKLSLSSEAGTGGYYAALELGSVAPAVPGSISPPAEAYRPQLAYVQFQVAEFRKPEFEVSVKPSKESYVNGETIDTAVSADLFFGAPLAGAAVKWTATSQPYFFRPDDFSGYSFTDYTPTYDDSQGPYYEYQQLLRGTGEGKTDAQGGFSFSVPADVANDRTSQTFTLEANVTDQNGQAVGAFAAVHVHKGRFYIGLRPDDYIATAGDDAKVNVVSVDPDGKTTGNVPAKVSIFERKWRTVRVRDADGQQHFQSEHDDTLVQALDVVTAADGKGAFSFKPQYSGEYYVLAEAKDSAGNAVLSSTSVRASSGEYASWRVGNDDTITLVADRDTYKPGDTAKILVAAPFTASRGLVTQERGRLLKSELRDFATNSEVIDVPITEDHVPNVFVSVMLFKAPTADNPLPQVKLGIVELKVSTDVKKLNIEISPDHDKLGPRETVKYTIRTTDSDGHGVPAELSLALVDKSVLSLQDDLSRKPLDAFWSRRSLSVISGSSFAASIDRANELAIRMTQGGKGGGGGPGDQTRTFFPNTAYWNAALRTDADGRATVDVQLPDTLTTWRLTARGITEDTKAGDAYNDIVTAKDVIIRPAVPRFLVAGDKAALGAIVHNFTGAAADIDVTLKADGVTVSGDASQRVHVEANADAQVRWETTVPPGRDSATLAFEAKAGGKSDAVKLTLPLYAFFTPETAGTAGEVTDQASEAVDVPYYVRPDAGELTVHVAPSLAAGVNTALTYIDEYPWESAEVTVSRFLPALALQRATTELGLTDVGSGDKRDVDALVQRSLQRLYSNQHVDGGWGWWSGDDSDPAITAWAAIGFGEARRAGYTVDARVDEQAVAYLTQQFDLVRDVAAPQLDLRAYLLYALARDGHGDLGRSYALAEQHALLGNAAKAWVALAIRQGGGNDSDPRLTTLLDELQAAAIPSATGNHWEEAKYDPNVFGNSTQTTAQVLQAFTAFLPAQPLVDGTLRWLMVARKEEGHWESPHDTAAALLAITDFMLVRKDAQANYDYRIDLNGSRKLSGKAEAGKVQQDDVLVIQMKDLLKDTVNELRLQRTPGDAAGRLYYTAHLRYFTPAEEVDAANYGIGVSHQYAVGDSDAPVRGAKLGDVVKVKVTLVAPADLNFLVLEDYLPAGLEPIDTSLKTTPPEFQRQLSEAQRKSYQVGKGYSPFGHTDIRDNRVALFARFVAKAVYEYTYFARATTPGEFRLPPATAYEQFFPEVSGRSDGGLFTVGG
jgi:alpha-2-macroglobulin